jgi:hypothetical protein
MATRHNICTNPCASVAITGWVSNGTAPTRSTGLTGFPDRTTGATYTNGTALGGPIVAVTAGQTVTLSAYVRSNTFNTNAGTVYAQWSGGGSSSSAFTLTAGVVKRISITATVPSGQTSVQIIMDGQNFASSSYDLTECLYEVAGSLGTYFDGDTAGATWDGTTGLSASTLPDASVPGPQTLVIPNAAAMRASTW